MNDEGCAEGYDDDDEEELPVVAAVSTMTDEIFIKHMNTRHVDALKLSGEGLIDLRSSWDDQVYTYRAFHRRLHDVWETHMGLNHIHNEETIK